MSNNYEAMSTVIPKLLAYLEQEGYSKVTVEKYRTTFNSISMFSNRQTGYVFDSEQCSAYVAWVLDGKEYKEIPLSRQNKIRCANALLEFQLTGNIFFRKIAPVAARETGQIYDILYGYLSEKEKAEYRQKTIYTHKRYLMQFCQLLERLGFQDFSTVSMAETKKYLDSLSFYKQGTGRYIWMGITSFIDQRRISPVKCSGIMDFTSDNNTINTNNHSFFGNGFNFCVLCVILHFRYLSVQ